MDAPFANEANVLKQMKNIRKENEKLKKEINELQEGKEQDLAGIIHYQDQTHKLEAQQHYLIRQNFLHSKKIKEQEQRLRLCTEQMRQSHGYLVTLEQILKGGFKIGRGASRNITFFYHRTIGPRIRTAKNNLFTLGGSHVLDAPDEIDDINLWEFQQYKDMKHAELEDWYNSPQSPEPDTALI